MAWEWVKKVIHKIAAEVHKTQISEFEKRVQNLERKHEMMLKVIGDNQQNISRLEERIYSLTLETSKTNGIVKTLIYFKSDIKTIETQIDE